MQRGKDCLEEEYSGKPRHMALMADAFTNYLSCPPSLENIVLFSIAVREWDATHIAKWLDDQFSSLMDQYTVLKTFERTSVKCNDFCLPASLKLKSDKATRIIGLQLCKWIFELKTFKCDINTLLENENMICWTLEGTIDKVSSVKRMIKFQILHMSIDDKKTHIFWYGLFKLACTYCIVEYISVLWVFIRSKGKTGFEDTPKEYDDHLTAYWTASEKNELPNFLTTIAEMDYDDIYDRQLSLNENMVSLCVHRSNIFSLKYFWSKISETERKLYLEKWSLEIWDDPVESVRYQEYSEEADVFVFLLSQLDSRILQKFFYHGDHETILKYFFYFWPHQRYLLPTITVMMDYLSEKVYTSLMSSISAEIKEGRDTGILFLEIWNISPLRLKKSFIQNSVASSHAIFKFICILNIGATYELLCNASAEERRQIFLELAFKDKLYNILCPDKLTLVDTLMKENLSSDDILSFKHFLMAYYVHSPYWMKTTGDYQAEEEFLTWVLQDLYKMRSDKMFCIDIMKAYTTFIYLDNYERVDKLLNWYFDTEADICSFKRTFIEERNCERIELFLDLLASRGKEGWEQFQKFLNYTFSSPDDVACFKKLNQQSVLRFVFSGHLEFATLFLNWYFESTDEIIQFKNDFIMLRKPMFVIFVDALSRIKYHSIIDWNSYRNKLKWFSLRNETIALIKPLLPQISRYFRVCRKCDGIGNCSSRCKQRILLLLLDSLVEDGAYDKRSSNKGFDFEYILKEESNLVNK